MGSSFNGKRLQQARRRRGFSRRRLAHETGIAERTLGYNESGEHPPNEQHLEMIARVLDFPTTFFVRDDPELIEPDGVSFRSMSRMTAGQRNRVLAKAELAMELSTWLDEQFVLPKADFPDLHHQTDPESAATALRSYWSLGDRPIPNMVHLLEKKGVRVFSLAEDCDAMDAFSFWNATRPYVFLNTMKSGERGRFDAAHELGHLVMHHHGSSTNNREAENQANRFASCFLMPKASIVTNQPFLKNLSSLIEAKAEWGVSVLALAHRLHAAGLLSPWYYRQVCIEAQQFGMRKREPNPIDRERSQVLHKVLTILWQRKVTPDGLAAHLGWPKTELDSLTFQFVQTNKDPAQEAARKRGEWLRLS